MILKFYFQKQMSPKLHEGDGCVNVLKFILKRVDLLHKQLSLSVCKSHFHENDVWKSFHIYFCLIPPAVSMPTNVFRIICYCNNSYPIDQVVATIFILCTLYYDLCCCIAAVHTLNLIVMHKRRLDSLLVYRLHKPKK